MSIDAAGTRIAPPPPPPPPPPPSVDVAARLGTQAQQLVQSALDRFQGAFGPLEQGLALRELDGLLGRQGTQQALTQQATGPDRLDESRNAGRGSVRPSLGDGPAEPSGVTPGAGTPGFPTPPAPPATGDGSGTHGVDSPGLGDRLFEQVAYRAADAADGLGMSNAARNLRHYLGNSGDTLQIDPAAMKADLPQISAEMDRTFNTQVRDVALARVEAQYDGKPMQFQITTPWNGAYATPDMSKDWFYGVGGFSYAHTATVTVTPDAQGNAQVQIDSQLHVFDRYNWDGGKKVNIGPIEITDDQMGRLHEVGLAREFEVRGTATGPSVNVTVPR